MLRAATSSASPSRYYSGRQLLCSASSSSSSSAQLLARPPICSSRCTGSAYSSGLTRYRHFHTSPSSPLAAPAVAHRHTREQQPPPFPHKSGAQNQAKASSRKGAVKTATGHTTTKQDAVSRSDSPRKAQQQSASVSESTPTSTSTAPTSSSSSSPPPSSPSPPPPSKPNQSISEKVKGLYHQIKFLFRFYINGVKQIWRDRQRVQELKASGRELVWSEKRLVRTHADDLKKLPLFLAILIILEEILPLVVIYAPSLLPSTCILPSQLEKIRQAEELKRVAAVDRLRKSKEVQDLMALAGWSLQKAGDKQDTIAAVQEVFPRNGTKGDEIAEKLKALSKDVLIDFSRVFSLGTAMRTTSMMRSKLESHMTFLTTDDHALRGSSSTSTDYSQVPEAGPILAEISSQRGMRCCELESSDMFENMRDWLRVTSVFNVPNSSNTTDTQLASPVQLLFLPLLLYPAPLFTPSLNKLHAMQADENAKGILERSKEVAREVVAAEEKVASREDKVKEEEKSRRG